MIMSEQNVEFLKKEIERYEWAMEEFCYPDRTSRTYLKFKARVEEMKKIIQSSTQISVDAL